jgi:hypothetical protein
MFRTRARLGAVVVATLALGLAGCGDDDDAAPRATPTTASSAQPDLEKLLMLDGEEPGFTRGAQPDARPSALQTLVGLDAFAADLQLPEADKTRLKEEGFLAFSAAPIRSGSEYAGVTNVSLYATATGATRSMANDLQPSVIQAGGPLRGLRFFDVPGVPGARGWAATDPPVGNVLWVEGRCFFVLGNQGPGSLTEKLTKGVQAMYARTKGQCP